MAKQLPRESWLHTTTSRRRLRQPMLPMRHSRAVRTIKRTRRQGPRRRIERKTCVLPTSYVVAGPGVEGERRGGGDTGARLLVEIMKKEAHTFPVYSLQVIKPTPPTLEAYRGWWTCGVIVMVIVAEEIEDTTLTRPRKTPTGEGRRAITCGQRSFVPHSLLGNGVSHRSWSFHHATTL